MSLLEQSIASMKSETDLIIGSNFSSSCKRYNPSMAFIEYIDIIWQDTTSIGLIEDSDISTVLDNDDFYTDSGWVKGTGWSISADSAICDGSQSAPSCIKQLGKITEFCKYRIKMIYTKTAGNIFLMLDGSIVSQTGYLGSSDCDLVLRAFSDGDFCIYGDSNLEVTISDLICEQIDPITKNKYDAIGFCSFDQALNIGDFVIYDDITYIAYRIDIELDHKKAYFLKL